METNCPEPTNRLLIAFIFISLAAAAGVHGQAVSNPNQITGTIELTNTNPAVLAILNGPSDSPPGAGRGFFAGKLRADSIGTTPTFNNTTSVIVASGTTATYEVTVETSPAGISYRVYDLDMNLANSAQYIFAEQNSLLLLPEPEPDVELEFAECAGIVDVRFVDQDGSPVVVEGGSIIARLQPSNVIQAQAFGLQAETSSGDLAVRGDGSDYRIDISFFRNFGSDPHLDLIRIEGQCQEFLTMQCDEIQVVECVVPFDDEGGVDTQDLGEIVGEIDMLGEDEHRIPVALTVIGALGGPFNNQRFDFVDNTPPFPPSSGAFLLPNVLRSDFVSPPRAYLAWSNMSFRLGTAYEFFRTPFLGIGPNPGVVVDGGMVTDLGDTFVMSPGFLDVDIELAGPPVGAQGSCLEDIIQDADVDTDGDGIPNNIAVTSWSHLQADGLGPTRDWGRPSAL